MSTWTGRLGRFPRRCWTKARAAKFLSFVHHLPLGRPHRSSHCSSVSLGAFGQHPQPVLLERQLHFFVLRPGDSSEEAQRGCKEGLTFQTGAWHPAPTSPWWYRCKIFIQLSYSGLILSNCSFCVSITHLPDSVARFLHLVCLWKNSLVLLPCSNCSPSPLLAPYCLTFHILFFSFFFSWTQPQLCAALLNF